jgi:hypothetical protein
VSDPTRKLRPMGPVARFRERLVVGPLRATFGPGESLLAWAHARVPGVRPPAVLVVTDQRCLVHIASPSVADTYTQLGALVSFDLDRVTPETVGVRLNSTGEDVVAELSLTTRARSRAAGRVLSALVHQNVGGPDSFDPSQTSPLPPMPRGVKDHARRVWVTVVGVLVLLLSLAFATPFVPGPGALDGRGGHRDPRPGVRVGAGRARLGHRQAERFVAWVRSLRSSRPGHAAAPSLADQAGQPSAADLDDLDEDYERVR